MKNYKGVAIILFAILFQLCSTGLEIISLAIGGIGLALTIYDDAKQK